MFGGIMQKLGRGAGLFARNPKTIAGLGLGAIGAGYGAYQADPRRGQDRLTAAGIGAGVGLAGGIGGVMLANKGISLARTARGKAMQGIGRMRSGTEMYGPFQKYGPIQRSNESLSSCKQNVASQKAKIWNILKNNILPMGQGGPPGYGMRPWI